MRKVYWYISAYLRKHGWKVLLATLLAIGVFSLVLPWFIKTITRRNTYYIGIVGEYYLDNLPEVIRKQLSRSLMSIDNDGNFIPDVAEKVIIEEGGKRYRFLLPQTLKWQNGDQFTAEDINYKLQDVTVTRSKDEIVYDLPDVFSSFPQYLTDPLLKPVSTRNRHFAHKKSLVGLNQVEIADVKYHDASKTSLSEIILDDLKTHKRYIYRFYFTQDQAVTAFKMGEIDYLFDVTNVEELTSWSNVTVSDREISNQYLAIFFNYNDSLLSKNLRLALSYAVNKERGGYTRAVGPIPEDSWAFLKGLKTYGQNYDNAVERLLSELPGEPIELEVVTTSSYYSIAEEIKANWETLGDKAAEACQNSADIKKADKNKCEYLRLKVKIQIQSFPNTGNFQILLLGQEVSLYPDQYQLWHSGLATNFTHYKNTKVDSLLEKGRTTLDQTERLTIYQEFQQALLDDPPAIFLWYLKSSDLARK